MKKIILLLLFIILSSFVLGDIAISDCQGLYNIRNNLNEDYYLSNDINCGSFGNFQPIPSFSGNFDGYGHIINNLYSEHASEPRYLFSGNSGTIRRVGLVNVNINGRGGTGALVGSNSGTISQCFVTGTVSGDNVGGLVGENFGIIEDSYSKANMLGMYGAGGGLVWKNCGTIRRSYASARIANINHMRGGLAAEHTYNCGGRIDYSFATGNWNTHEGWVYSGGLVGYTNGGAIYNSRCALNICVATSDGGSLSVPSHNIGYFYNTFASPMDSWSFSGSNPVWSRINQGVDYPILQWQVDPPDSPCSNEGDSCLVNSDCCSGLDLICDVNFCMTQTQDCNGVEPLGLGYNKGGNTYQHGTLPDTWTYTTNPIPDDCEYTCNAGYLWDSGSCGEIIDGQCDNTVENGCSQGDLFDILDTPTEYIWNCEGINSDVDDICSKRKYSGDIICSLFNVTCDTNQADVDSVMAYVDGISGNYCGSPIGDWQGNTATFQCNYAGIITNYDQTYDVICAVDPDKSYQDGENTSLEVMIVDCGVEICYNGVDDDGDGFADEEDGDCGVSSELDKTIFEPSEDVTVSLEAYDGLLTPAGTIWYICDNDGWDEGNNRCDNTEIEKNTFSSEEIIFPALSTPGIFRYYIHVGEHDIYFDLTVATEGHCSADGVSHNIGDSSDPFSSPYKHEYSNPSWDVEDCANTNEYTSCDCNIIPSDRLKRECDVYECQGPDGSVGCVPSGADRVVDNANYSCNATFANSGNNEEKDLGSGFSFFVGKCGYQSCEPLPNPREHYLCHKSNEGIVEWELYSNIQSVPETSCADGYDNDCNNLVDCADPNCAGELGPNGVNCCVNPSDDCDDLDCSAETCDVNNECDYIPRNLGDSDEVTTTCYHCDGISNVSQANTSEDGIGCSNDCTSCVAGICDVRTQCDSVECGLGFECDGTDLSCTDLNEYTQKGEDVCEACLSADLARHNYDSSTREWLFDDPTKQSCCENAPGEYYITTDIDGTDYNACCSNFDDVVDENGLCVITRSKNCNITTESVDLNCLADECCYQPYQYIDGTCISDLSEVDGAVIEDAESNSCLCMVSGIDGVSNGLCDTEDESPCWDVESGACCGNVAGETWSTIFNTHKELADILVKGYCEAGVWKSRNSATQLTYYDMWTES